MANDHAGFWLHLLTLTDTPDLRAATWNHYLYWKAPKSLQKSLIDINKRLDLNIPVTVPPVEQQRDFDQVAQLHGGHPPIPTVPDAFKSPVMDFSGHEFKDDASFDGCILLGAKFENTTFEKNAWFRNALFIGATNFSRAKFKNEQNNLGDGNVFDKTIFQNTAHFKEATFNYWTSFGDTKFMSSVYFNDAKFVPIVYDDNVTSGGLSFRGSEFHDEASFKGARLQVGIGLEECIFHSDAIFEETKFGRLVTFNNSTLKARTSFKRAHFKVPPKFFEARLHEDTDFGEVRWDEAEESYMPPRRMCFLAKGQSGQKSSFEYSAGAAVRAWDRLALIMSQFEKPHERHTFYRLRMRAHRVAGLRGPLFLANWLFDHLCDYGWGLGRALVWWAGHMIVMALVLACCAKEALSVYRPSCAPALWESLVVSFANAHAIFSLGSHGGYLHGVRECLERVVQPEWMMSTVGTVQAVVGPILLFLLLLTVRNRFRLG